MLWGPGPGKKLGLLSPFPALPAHLPEGPLVQHKYNQAHQLSDSAGLRDQPGLLGHRDASNLQQDPRTALASLPLCTAGLHAGRCHGNPTIQCTQSAAPHPAQPFLLLTVSGPGHNPGAIILLWSVT